MKVNDGICKYICLKMEWVILAWVSDSDLPLHQVEACLTGVLVAEEINAFI